MSSTAVALTLGIALLPAPLLAQQDTSMKSHDAGMMDHGTMNHDKMDHGKMGHDAMGKGMDKMGEHDAMGSTMFMAAAGQAAAGDYTVVDGKGGSQLQLGDKFSVAAAPDLYLVLATGPTPDGNALYLGKLQRSTGAQSYKLPKGKALDKYTTLLVWSKKEGRAVATAEWHAAGGGSMDRM
jgi:hypothetical protein